MMAKRPVHADQPRAKDIAARLGEAIKERDLAQETLTRVETERIAVIGGRDEARAELKAQIERAGVLEEALHGEYGTNARWQRAYQQATAERDEARGEALLLRQEVARLEALHVSLCAHRAQADLERDELRAALEKYGRHRVDCRWLTGPCTCGLDAALGPNE